jgi:hypothetical protein
MTTLVETEAFSDHFNLVGGSDHKVQGGRSKWGSCAVDDEADARRSIARREAKLMKR